MGSNKKSIIELREIEALIAVPLIKGYIKELGRERAIYVATKAIQEKSWEAGRQAAEELGSNTMSDLVRIMSSWTEGGALKEEILEQTDKTYFFNVTYCRYAEKYDEIGIKEFGYCLSCCRDKPFIEGFNPNIKFKRTQTIMEDSPYCDFRLTME